MKQKQVLRFAWVLVALLSLSMACQALTDIGQSVQNTRDRVESAATDIQQGRDLVGTARSLATLVGNSDMLKTAQALAAELGESGLLETARAFATEQGPGLIETAQEFATQQGPGLVETVQALATQQGPGLIETAQAAATQQGSGLVETAQAVATQAARTFGQPPADIPLVEGEKDVLFSSNEFVSYTTTLAFQAVLQFYKDEMPANEWVKTEAGWFEGNNTAVMQYDKPERRAIITLSADGATGKTTVLITIQPK